MEGVRGFFTLFAYNGALIRSFYVALFFAEFLFPDVSVGVGFYSDTFGTDISRGASGGIAGRVSTAGC